MTQAPNPTLAAKLRGLADGLQGQIDAKYADRQTNTPKRQREVASARLDGHRLKRTQQGLRAMADHYEAGTVPDVLLGLKSKAEAFDLAYARIESNGGYYDAGREIDGPGRPTPEALAFWALLKPPSAEELAARDLKAKIEALKFANIPGYFPTPAGLVERMIEAADLTPGCSVLEPSAGSGAILDLVAKAEPTAKLSAYERNHSLRAILAAKGYADVGDDFTDFEPRGGFDRVLMNPPFENGQDMAHVMRAYEALNAGGRLVAIMSPGPFFRSDAKARAFRVWFDELGGEKTDIEAGAFKASGTGVSTVMVELRA